LITGFLNISQPAVDILSIGMFSSVPYAGSHCTLVLTEYDNFAACTISCGLESMRSLYASVVPICQIVGVRSNLWECGTGMFEESTLASPCPFPHHTPCATVRNPVQDCVMILARFALCGVR